MGGWLRVANVQKFQCFEVYVFDLQPLFASVSHCGGTIPSRLEILAGFKTSTTGISCNTEVILEI